ncbi:hypothetical protein H70357_34130 [Paenibacillus sp. FSL H7-0357]|uniref:radical SAM protein n=1 Tax=Paenibacillus sp. FSL H7-0357 TaxID=1536774 RepID=UPI0004F5E7A0|nr:radical SAM protein [Paenibacillus sp. FSL H7-0357]AIQ21163.1 hypothetical protein H70357_34130 [Paenibacillus sp. FSL H7-0357]
MNYKYFNLYPECYLEVGEKNSVIHNLLQERMVVLDEESTQLLLKCEKNELVSTDEKLVKELSNMGWGFFSDTKIFIDKLRTVNVFNQKKFWKDTPVISSAVLQLTNQCNLDCSFCSSAFCPMCIKLENNTNDMRVEDWYKLIDELNFFGVTNLVLTGGEPAIFPQVVDIVNYGLNKQINITISTNGLIKINELPLETHLYINLFDSADLGQVTTNYDSYDNVTIALIDIDFLPVAIKQSWRSVRTSLQNPVIKESSIIKTGMNKFFIKKMNDWCLSGRVTICHNGDVISCLGKQDEVVGNVNKMGISSILKILVEEYWNKPVYTKDTSGKCIRCEFKYACNACNKVNIEKSCEYNLEAGLWKSN